MNFTRSVIYIVSLICFFWFSGCKSNERDSDSSQSKAQVNLEVSCQITGIENSITGNSLQEVTYRWTGLDEAITEVKPLMAKVHFVNSDGKVLFQDDHQIPLTGTDNYTRQLLIPLIPRTQQITMLVGVYSHLDKRRFAIKNNAGDYQHKVKCFDFKVTPPVNIDDLPEARITFLDGWYEKEYGNTQNESWRWIQQEAKCRLKGAEKELILYIHGWVPKENRSGSFDMTLVLDNEELAIYKDLKDEFIIKTVVPADKIGENKFADLVISSNQSFKPAEFGNPEDTRTLSAMIKQIYFN